MAISDSIEPWVTKPKGKPFYVIRWKDPKTLATRQRSTGETRRREAERMADDLAKQLRLEAMKPAKQPLPAGEFEPPKLSELTEWQVFCDRYLAEWLNECRTASVKSWENAKNHIDRILKPTAPADLTAEQLSTFKARLLAETKAGKDGISRPLRGKDTVEKVMRTVMAALRWADDLDILEAAPKLPRRRRGQNRGAMKGRPIAGEEFERMLAKTGDVVGAEFAESWQPVLWHAWLGGLRLAELLMLHWTNRDMPHLVEIDHPEPLLFMPEEFDKGGQTRLLPIAPEWAEYLRQTPPSRRTGSVVNPMGPRGVTRDRHWVSARVSEIGEAAIVVVKKKPKQKFASLHDLRRSFGDRWAARVMPPVLQLLMRHDDIKTTMKFYVGRESRRLSSSVWDWHEKHGADRRDPKRDPSNPPVSAHP